MSSTGKPEEISAVFWIKETEINPSSIGLAPQMSTENGPRDRVRNCGESILINLRGKCLPLPDVHAVREDLADYLGEIAAFDAGLGILIDELKKRGDYENTLIVVSGDHGPPGFPHGKCNLYDFGTKVCLAIAGPGVKGGRVVDDFTCLPDLAPTFLEAGNVDVPKVMSARSLWPVLKSKKQGQVDKTRDAAITGRERHVHTTPGIFAISTAFDSDERLSIHH